MGPFKEPLKGNHGAILKVIKKVQQYTCKVRMFGEVFLVEQLYVQWNNSGEVLRSFQLSFHFVRFQLQCLIRRTSWSCLVGVGLRLATKVASWSIDRPSCYMFRRTRQCTNQEIKVCFLIWASSKLTNAVKIMCHIYIFRLQYVICIFIYFTLGNCTQSDCWIE